MKRITNEEKLQRITEYNNASPSEKKLLLKKYNYANIHSMATTISIYRNELNLGSKISRRVSLTEEEIIEFINKWNKCCSTKEREELAKSYGYTRLESARSAINEYKRNNMPRKITYTLGKTNEERLEFTKKWDKATRAEREEMAKKINVPYERIYYMTHYCRKANGLNRTVNRMTDEEKIDLVDKYNSLSPKGKIELASQLNITLESLREKVRIFKRRLNL